MQQAGGGTYDETLYYRRRNGRPRNAGLAIARYFEKRQPDTVVRFAGSARGIENKLVPREGYPLDSIEIIGLVALDEPEGHMHNLKRRSSRFPPSQRRKRCCARRVRDCVIGCGGYASFAVVKAAQELDIPTVLLEVNALPGKVTQMLSKKADRVLVCFEQAKQLLGGGEKIILTGAPVRGEILAASREKAAREVRSRRKRPACCVLLGLDGREVYERAHGGNACA